MTKGEVNDHSADAGGGGKMGVPSSGPGALRSEHTLHLQTYQAQKLFTGRGGNKAKSIVGLTRYAALLNPIWKGAQSDDPYADWWLINVNEGLVQGKSKLAEYQGAMSTLIEGVEGVDIHVAESIEPISFTLTFSNPYSFRGAFLLTQFDALVRSILTARHVGLLDREESERKIYLAGKSVRHAYTSALGYRFSGVTRESVSQGTQQAQEAAALMGAIPKSVLSGDLRAEHAPRSINRPVSIEVLAKDAARRKPSMLAMDPPPEAGITSGGKALEDADQAEKEAGKYPTGK